MPVRVLGIGTPVEEVWVTAAKKHEFATAHDLMFDALRQLEEEMHGVAPRMLKGGIKDIPDKGVARAAEGFLDAIRACVHEVFEEVREERERARK